MARISQIQKYNPLVTSKLPIHFKLPGRSYSQIGRKGNVALYSVYSDYLSLPDFALPYILIGYELIVIKIMPNGQERYPRDEDFGKSAWSIPKASFELAQLAMDCAVSDGINIAGPHLKPFLTGRPLPKTAHARLWRRIEMDGKPRKPIKRATKMPQTLGVLGLTND